MVQPRVKNCGKSGFVGRLPSGLILTAGGPSKACRQPRPAVPFQACLGRLGPIWRAFELWIWRPLVLIGPSGLGYKGLEPESSKSEPFRACLCRLNPIWRAFELWTLETLGPYRPLKLRV